MGSLQVQSALERLGRNVRSARLRRGMSIADLAVRAGASASTIVRLEKGDPGVRIGTLADTLVVFGLVDRLADLIDVRKDDLGLALIEQSQRRRGRSTIGKVTRDRSLQGSDSAFGALAVDPEGLAF